MEMLDDRGGFEGPTGEERGETRDGRREEILCAVIGFYVNSLPHLSRRSSVENIHFLLVHYPVESVY